MSERLPVELSELERPSEVFNALATARHGAMRHREAYLSSVHEMNELCKSLRGVEVLLSGRIHGMGGTTVYAEDPRSQVERLHVRIGSAQVDTYEGYGELVTRNTPFIQLTAWTVEQNELIVARLGVGDFGVEAEIVESSPVQL